MSHIITLQRCGDDTLILLLSPLGVCDQVMTLIYHTTSAAFHKFMIIYQPVHLRMSSSSRTLCCVQWNE